MLDLAELLSKNGVMSPVLCYSRKRVFEIIGSYGQNLTGMRADAITEGLNSREKCGSTYVNNGFAVPHITISSNYKEAALFIALETPITYNQNRDEADLFLALFLHKDTAMQCFDSLEQIANYLSDTNKTKYLRSLKNLPAQVFMVLKNYCAELSTKQKEEQN